MSVEASFALPAGSLILVTGANGYIGSHVCNELLKHGYRVRGSVRSPENNAWLPKSFNNTYGVGSFELVEVPVMEAPGAFAQAIKGAAGLVHVATPVMRSSDPNGVIPMVVSGAVNAMKAAMSEPGIRRVVVTSSATAATNLKPNKRFSIDAQSWNDGAVRSAREPSSKDPAKLMGDVYAASKTESERAVWQFMRENKPSFVLNTILPDMNIGKVLFPEHQGTPTTIGWVKAAWENFEGHEQLKSKPPQWYVNVQDNAKLHVAALLFPDVTNERVFAFAHPFTWTDIISIFRKIDPGKEFHEVKNTDKDLSEVANARSEELLRRLGQDGWTDLEQTVRQAVANWAA